MDAGRGLFRHAFDARSDARKPLRIAGHLLAEQIEDDTPLLRLVARIELGNALLSLAFDALVHEKRRIAAVIDNQRRPFPIGPHQCLGRAPPVLFQRLAFPREDGDPFRIGNRAAGFRSTNDHSCGSVILGGEDVAAHPTDVRTEKAEGLDQHGRLHRHV